MSSGKSKSKAEEGIAKAGSTAYDRGKMTDSESKAYEDSFRQGRMLDEIYQHRLLGEHAPAGYQDPTKQYMRQTGDLGGTLYKQTLEEAQDPNKFYESTLQPELELAGDAINRYWQSRGLMRSGMNIENMGRAGVDLAIKSAQGRMQSRDMALQRAAGLTDFIQGVDANNMAGLTGIYGQRQQAGQNAMGRQSGAAQNAATYQAYPYQSRLGDYYGQRSALMGLPGQIIGAAGNVGMGMAMGGTGFFK